MTSHSIELLLSVGRDRSRTLGKQIEDQLRQAIRNGALRPGGPVPSTRDLARQLGVSRPIVVDAYAQLAAEGFLALRQGARTRVAMSAARAVAPATHRPEVDVAPRFDFRPAVPDFSAFPRAAWLRATRDALAAMRDDDLGYRNAHGCGVLQRALAEYLGRVRGVAVAEPERIVITSGFAQARALVCKALRAIGARRMAVEDPSYSEWDAVSRAGLELLPIRVDEDGLDVAALERADADAVMLTPAHQFPTGVVMSGERRLALLAWLRARDAVALEDDYDAEFRYDRAPVGALQALAPERVVYAGTASKTLAPALRIGWLVAPPRLLEALRAEQRYADYGCPRIEQHVLAQFIASGELDRHLRRLRPRYRARRDALVAALARELPEAEVCGIAAGLHATVRLPRGYDERVIREEARRRGIALEIMAQHRIRTRGGAPTLLLGYARSPEPTIAAGIRDLASAIRASRQRS